jgi:UDP-N-acetylmuramate dehydrogenase
MMIVENISLKPLNTFGFDARARYFASPETPDEAKSAVSAFDLRKTPVFVLGGGSNVVFTHDYPGLVVQPRMSGVDRISEDDKYVRLAVGAGVALDSLIEYAVEHELSGLENLSLIPGSVGAAPVQNVGAYGVEAKDTIESVEGFYLNSLSDFKMNNADCRFAYRDSIFKRELKGQVLITRVVFKLRKYHEYNVSYGNVEEELQKYGEVNLANIRRAIIDIRSRKLPNPAILGNAGSFFKNPVTDKAKADELRAAYPDIPIYNAPDGTAKIAAGKLIELCGFKGARLGNVGVHDKQSLVLVNFGGATPAELLQLSDKIRKTVRDTFGVEIEPEVNIL